MRIKFLGHSCFKIESERGITIVTDPFDDSVGYRVPDVKADIVTISHEHFDHNFTKAIKGEYELINKAGEFYVKDIPIRGVMTCHDKFGGRKRGSNIVYVMDVDGIRVCHLGDLGHILDEKQVSLIGGIDVLLIPVGGNFTIDFREAVKVVKQLKPSIVIPMHYKTPVVSLPIDSVEPFLKEMGSFEKVSSTEMEITRDMLDGRGKVYVLKYE